MRKCGDTLVLGVRDKDGFKEINCGAIRVAGQILSVKKANGLTDLYFINEDSLMEVVRNVKSFDFTVDIDGAGQLLFVKKTDGLNDVYLIKQGNLMEAARNIQSFVSTSSFFIYQDGFEYHFFEVSSGKDYFLGRSLKSGIFLDEAKEGTFISYVSSDHKLVRQPLVRIESRSNDEGDYLLLEQPDGGLKIIEMPGCGDNPDLEQINVESIILAESALPVFVFSYSGYQSEVYVYDKKRKRIL